MFEFILIVCVVVIFTLLAWFDHCNDKTLRQRSSIIKNIPSDDFFEKMDRFRQVTYNQHLWALFFFRDPYKLYDHSIFK